MFIGSIDAEFRQWLATNAAAFRGRNVYVGCSGNFTIEQVIGEHTAEMHGNDVSIYSHFLGHHLAGQTVEWTIREEAKQEWGWLAQFFERNPGAAIVLLFELLKVEKRKSHHDRRLFDAMLADWEARFEKTCERVEAAKLTCRLTKYTSMDIWDFIEYAQARDSEAIIFAFLPFYKGDYEKLYKKLNQIFSWTAPSYTIIDRDRKAALLKKVAGCNYVFIDDVLHDGLQPVMWKRRSRTKDVWMYSNLPLLRVFCQSHTKSVPTYYHWITEADVDAITADSPLVIRRVKGAEINYFKNLWMKKTIQFTDGTWNFLFFIDGKLFGCAVASLAKYGDDSIYILSDFVVPQKKESRMAKLLLLSLQTERFKDLLEQILLSPIPVLKTTAFTDKPVSMKYRGIFELLKRGEGEDGTKFLNYGTKTGLHDNKQALTKWITKYRKG